MNEMILKPRQRPKRPPREEKNSTGPILMLLSSSGKDQSSTFNLSRNKGSFICSFNANSIFRFTHDSLLAKVDVECGQVFFPGIVAGCFNHILKKRSKLNLLIVPEFIWLTIHQWPQFNEGVVVLLSIGARQILDIVRQQGSILSPIHLFHLMCKYTCWSND